MFRGQDSGFKFRIVAGFRLRVLDGFRYLYRPQGSGPGMLREFKEKTAWRHTHTLEEQATMHAAAVSQMTDRLCEFVQILLSMLKHPAQVCDTIFLKFPRYKFRKIMASCSTRRIPCS